MPRLLRRAVSRRGLLVILPVLLVIGVGLCAFLLGSRATQAREEVALMRADAQRLQTQAAAYDLAGAGTSLARLRSRGERARELTGGPLWRAAGAVPVFGDDADAARRLSGAVADVLAAATPLETALPALDPEATRRAGGRIDVRALAAAADAVPALSDAVNRAQATVGGIDADGLSPQLADGVRTLEQQLTAVRDPLANAAPSLSLVPPMLGSQGSRSWLVLLQQNAEARGTGGIVGAYAHVRTDAGRLTLVRAAQRGTLGRAPIPASAVPAQVRALWGRDLSEWAGLNLSPHYPWTGQLVAAGWRARPQAPRLDYVAAIDQHTVAALLAGTGPVTVRGDRIGSGNAVTFLSRDVYLRYPDYRDVDAVTAEIVQSVFARVAAGRLDLRALVRTMSAQVEARRLLVWSADPAEQARLQETAVGGAIPDRPGPFAMAVVNNGGGNKLDAYLKVHTRYLPGRCAQDVRIGTIQVRLTNGAPRSGLPPYVVARSDLTDRGKVNRVPGSNRVLLDVYGPVAATSPLATLDGREVPAVVGSDRNHAVWRVQVPLDPGQTRLVRLVVVEPLSLGRSDGDPQVVLQPMAVPATAEVRAPLPCDAPRG